MALGSTRILLKGDTEHSHERDGIAFVEEHLPNHDPYYVWELVELLEPSTGRLSEIDLIVLGHNALYLLELKGGPGRYTGTALDWLRHQSGDRPRPMKPPLRDTNFKCKVLKSLLARRAGGQPLPRVEPLVFLSHPEVEVDLRADGRVGVVTRQTVIRALTHHEYPGASLLPGQRKVDKPMMRTVVEAMRAIGVREQAARSRVGPYKLGELLEDGPGYQDRAAEHTDLKTVRRRARIYLVPQQTSVERRRQLLRAAEREAGMLIDIRGSRYVLSCSEYISDAPQGPTVLFEDFEDGQPLEAFLRTRERLQIEPCLVLLRQLAHALDYCHKRGMVHGLVSPEHILVREGADGKLELRLYNFQLASSEQTAGTQHVSSFGSDSALPYQAPELREDQSAKKRPEADVFGLGAVAYRLLTNQAPGDSADGVESRLRKDRSLGPSAEAQGLPAALAECIAMATAYAAVDRIDEALFWVNELEERLTAPDDSETPPPEVSPLAARTEDVLGGDLKVQAVLGEGASSRVLQVLRSSDNRHYALKVALTEEDNKRLTAEALILNDLRHPRIVPLIEQRTLGDRVCLLLGLAGSETLQRELIKEGPVSLEYAARYGEDLLSALELLEERGYMHRDIKPANLGVGAAGKHKHHLTLFDFSLAGTALTELGAGTALYRDPFLPNRGRWDHAADRYSAAVTLHEMLTGSRPRWGSEDLPAADPRARLQLQAQSFDPALREQLTQFFECALSREVTERYPSADAMRKAWDRAFDEPRLSAPAPVRATGMASETTPSSGDVTVTAVEPTPDDGPPYTVESLQALPLDSPLEALPLGTRAKNALDRAGISGAGQVLALPDNRLSAIRGAGRKVQREIHNFREALAQAQSDRATFAPFFPDFRGEDHPLDSPELLRALPAAMVNALHDAGLNSMQAVAQAAAEQVKAVLLRADCAEAPLRSALEREHRAVDARKQPITLADWQRALLPTKASRPREYLESLFGLRSPFTGQLDVPVNEVARHFNVKPPNVYTALSKARSRWAEHPALPGLIAQLTELVQQAGGALPLSRAATLLRASLAPHGGPVSGNGEATTRGSTHLEPGSTPEPDLELALAAMLVRAAAEVDEAGDGALRHMRLTPKATSNRAHTDPDRPEPAATGSRTRAFVLLSEVAPDALLALGAVADRLAAREVPPSPAEAERLLRAAAPEPPLSQLAPAQLIALACAVSQTAAHSTRLEIYPKAMPAARALALTASLLQGGMSPEQVQQRVAARYPEATPLPPRPELDTLLTAHKLDWDEARQRYQRRNDPQRTSLGTHAPSWGSRKTTAAPDQPRSTSPEALSARDFDERLRAALESDAFRLLGVKVQGAPLAAEILVRRHGLRLCNFDALFLRELQTLTASGKPDMATVRATDAAGEDSPQWRYLRNLAADASRRLLPQLVPATTPTLLVQLGLTARYGLTEFLTELVAGAQRPESRSLFLLLPSPESGTHPKIEMRLTVPGVLPGQSLWIPGTWLTNAQHAAA